MFHMLIFLIWESISSGLNSSDSTSNSLYNLDYSPVHGTLSDQIIICSSSIGAFDWLPLDIFMQILKFLRKKKRLLDSHVFVNRGNSWSQITCYVFSFFRTNRIIRTQFSLQKLTYDLIFLSDRFSFC